MRTAQSPVRVALCLVAALVSLMGWAAQASGSPMGLSAIPLGSDALVPAHGTLRLADVRWRSPSFTTALDAPVCLRADPTFDETGVVYDTAYQPGSSPPDLIIERLVLGPDPVLERTSIERETVTLTSATITGRARVRLADIGTADLHVYAYRSGQTVHLLVPRGFRSPREAFGDFRMNRLCGFLHETLGGKEDSRTLRVNAPQPLPARARWISEIDELEAYEQKHPRDLDLPRFEVNASVSKLSRDPEPLLSVTVTPLPKLP